MTDGADGGTHSCPICGNQYESRIGVGNHMTSAHDDTLLEYESRNREGDHKCPSCGSGFNTENGLRVHRTLYCDKADDDRSVATCPTCGGEFSSKRGMKIHHKKEHDESIAGIRVSCEWCRTTIRRPQGEVKAHDRFFCKDECENSWRQENRSGEDHPCYAAGPLDDPEVLYSFYVGQRMNLAEIAERFGCGTTKVRQRLIKHDIELRDPTYARTDAPWHDRDLLARLYHDDFLDTTEIAERFGCNSSTIVRWMQRLDIERRNGTGQDSCHWGGGKSIYDAVKKLIGPHDFGRLSRDARKASGRQCEWCGKTREEIGCPLNTHHIIPVLSGGVNDWFNSMVLCPACHGTVDAFMRDEFGSILVDWPDEELPEGRERWIPNESGNTTESEQTEIAQFGTKQTRVTPADD